MSRSVIVAYTPKPGMAGRLSAVVAKHLEVLRSQGLATDRPAHVVRARDGTIVEVFEWVSADAIHLAHGNAAVQELWGEFAAVCDYTPLAGLAESQQMFAEFESVP